MPPDLRGRVVLLLNELVTNAIQHGGAGDRERIQVRLSSSSGRVRVEVHDPGSSGNGPVERVTPEGGWGLVLVDSLADRWGLDSATAGGSIAWFELDSRQRLN